MGRLREMHRGGRLVAMVTIVTAIAAASGADAALFHSGASGSCDGCHGKQAGNGTSAGTSSAYMLKGADASSTCLLCHEAPATGPAEEYYVSTPGALLGAGSPPQQLTPGGDFGWLKRTYRWVPPERAGGGIEETSVGDRHGHNIVAADFNYASDRTQVRAPGGIYPSSSLSCISCHDPHGTSITAGSANNSFSGAASAGTATGKAAASYRLLGGTGYQPKYDPSLPAFANGAPAAVAPADYNRSETSASTRVAYGSGMSEWCQNCHISIHAGTGFGHPAGNAAKLSGDIIANYNAYVGSGNLNGSAASSYTSLVPYEMGTDDYGVLGRTAGSTAASGTGPDPGAGTPNVMCLTCHRAHASGWDSMTRWNTRATFIVVNGRYPGIDNADSADSAQGRTTAETRKAYYDRQPDSFAVYQRSLCNKCHVRD